MIVCVEGRQGTKIKCDEWPNFDLIEEQEVEDACRSVYYYPNLTDAVEELKRILKNNYIVGRGGSHIFVSVAPDIRIAMLVDSKDESLWPEFKMLRYV